MYFGFNARFICSSPSSINLTGFFVVRNTQILSQPLSDNDQAASTIHINSFHQINQKYS